ncbi:regulator of chromosome condensation 1/beta-lactamase-inhibitor protein II [Neohortaea acidophila]|uniref:Regulator of chromosome condensation 1/beta-lactamase-inhibitor protein II n=1 Tax=Neohortaea acidophila TaxID=245834 RepID=A0A6A6PP63_9PEZI|nr:regulator of chromosome condensation 1/beta-lactamase-inhibitor protein II [Neohortaea acidophila]KAF2481802.1 regulator of chromosome condensation 1/beta-lactamase-inhibitor protein II [Neohortaea acidophila]
MFFPTMALFRSTPQHIQRCSRSISSRANLLARQNLPARATLTAQQSRAYRKQQHLLRSLLFLTAAGSLATLSNYYLQNNGRLLRTTHAESPEQEENPLVFEASRKQPGLSKEENRDLISSQHHQVKRSWENPGLYAWGSNTGRVVAPDRPEDAVVKTPRRISWFDGMLLRDVKLDRKFGAAINEQGDLVQWGTAYKPELRAPEVTLKGKDLVRLSISRDRILALGGNGKVYSISVSAEEQLAGNKPSEASWVPFWTWRSDISYRTIEPKGLGYREKVSAIDSGLEHAILLTSKGRVFSMASASDAFPNRGQLGVPGLTWVTRPEGAFDQPHEISTLNGFPIAQVACGDYHTLVLDTSGRVFSWGDNASGQLGFDFNSESTIIDAPSLLPTGRLYMGTSQVPLITSVAAGGSNSYITVEATRVASPNDDSNDARTKRMLGRVTADTFAFGTGIYGQLGNGRWTHMQYSPTKIPILSGLFEYDERTNRTVPIRLAHLSVGSTHAAAVMRNITYLSATERTSSDDTNWGADIVFWGGNESYQLGIGKRNNVPSPVYLQPLDAEAEVKRSRKSSGSKEEHRFHLTPRAMAKLGDGRWKSVEQRVECGRGVTAVYSGT